MVEPEVHKNYDINDYSDNVLEQVIQAQAFGVVFSRGMFADMLKDEYRGSNFSWSGTSFEELARSSVFTHFADPIIDQEAVENAAALAHRIEWEILKFNHLKTTPLPTGNALHKDDK